MYVHAILRRQPAPFNLFIVKEQHIALIVYAAITVVVAVDCRVVLIVAAQSAEPKDIRVVLMQIFIQSRKER